MDSLNIFRGVGKIDSIYDLLIIFSNIIQLMLTLCGVLAVIFIIWSGIRYIISQGDPGKVRDAKNGIIYSITGLVLASGAFILVEFLVRQFD